DAEPTDRSYQLETSCFKQGNLEDDEHRTNSNQTVEGELVLVLSEVCLEDSRGEPCGHHSHQNQCRIRHQPNDSPQHAFPPFENRCEQDGKGNASDRELLHGLHAGYRYLTTKFIKK